VRGGPHWLQEIIIFAVNTGLRQAEILDLTWDRLDLFRRTLSILEQKNMGKDTLPLNSQAIEVLKARGKVRSMRSNHVFFNREGKRHDAANLLRAFYIAVEKAGMAKARFHDLRHTFATRLVQAGVDLYKVQKLMRHKTPIMTQRYAHHYPESLRDGVETLDRISTISAQSKEKGATALP
jgi:integrase